MKLAVLNVEKGVPAALALKETELQMQESRQLLTDMVPGMYENLSSPTADLMRERAHRKLKLAYHKLETLAITGALTGLSNRRHFLAVFKRELRRAPGTAATAANHY